MKPIHEHEINTGKIYSQFTLKRKAGENIFRDPGTHKALLQQIEFAVRDHGMITRCWEQLTGSERAYLRAQEGLDKSYFLKHHVYIKGESTGEPYTFDIINYNENCVLTYQKDNTDNRFRFFFALKTALTDISKTDAFLNYQLKNNFQNVNEKFEQFLNDTLLTHEQQIPPGTIKKVTAYIKNNLLPVAPKNVPTGMTFKTPVKAYTPKKLRTFYKMSDKTFRSLVNDHRNEIGKLGKTRKYNPRQVSLIFYYLGDPADTTT